MSPDSDRSLSGLAFPAAPEHVRLRLFQQAAAVAGAVVLALWWTAGNAHDWAFLLGTAICALSMVPAVAWTRSMRYNYPIFEIFIATNLTSYGIPLLSEHDAVSLFREPVRADAGLAVLAFLLAACAAYYLTRGTARTTPFWAQPVLERADKPWLLRGLAVATLYTVVVPWFYAPPPGIDGILRAVLFGVGMTCIFILATAWGLGRLRRGEQGFVGVCLVLQFLLLNASLILRAGASILLLAIVGYFFGARRIPYLVLAVVLPLLAILNIGKYDMRDAYWTAEGRLQPSLTEIPGFYVDWIRAGLQPRAQRNSKAGQLLLERNSLLQILCLVVDRSPEVLPFLGGQTYAQIPGQFVPRAFWPEKPRGHISTYTLSIYYGLQDEDATHDTTIAFGFLPEAYANFGYYGVVGLGLVLGFGFRKITLWSARTPIFSPAGLLLILLTAWSFQTELTLSGWLASLFQAAAAIFVCAFVLRRIQQTRA